MASSNVMLNKKLGLILILFLAIFVSAESVLDHGLLQETNITVYIHDYFSGPNATMVPIGILPSDIFAADRFGTMYSTDNPVTEARDPDSDHVGRAQGTYVSSAQDGSSSQVVMSLVFDTEEYHGSTLEIQGAGPLLERVKEVSVVSGTGKFRYARGFATYETVFFDRASNYSVAEWNITMEHF